MKIKQYILSICVILQIVIFVQCSDYLDIVPDDTATIETAFENRQNLEKFLFTCYSGMPDPGDVHTYPGHSFDEFYIVGQDVTKWNLGDQEMFKIIQGLQNTNNTYLDFWGGTGGRAVSFMFRALRDCNIFLDNAHIPADIKEPERKKWIAEVKFLKAYYHYFLLQIYGPIPLIKKNLPVSVEPEKAKIYREPVDECFDYIVSLLDEAMEDLPEEIEEVTKEYYRITRPIAMAVKAKVLVTAASPLFNGGVPDFGSYIDRRGIALFPSQPDPQKWVKAADAAKAALEYCESKGYRLLDTTDVTSYVNLSTRVKQKILLRNVISKYGTSGMSDNPEVIWAINKGTNTQKGNLWNTFEGGIGNPGCVEYLFSPSVSVSSATFSYVGYGGATLNTAKLFYTDKGIPIEIDPDWVGKDISALRIATEEDKDYILQGGVTAELNFNREPRFYADLAFDRGYYVLNQTKNTSGIAILALRGEFAGSGYFNQTGYWPVKLVGYTASDKGDGFSPSNYMFPIIRMADLYLLYAEALNETMAQPSEEVFDAIDRVRARAGLKDVRTAWAMSTNPNGPATREGMREIIHREREIELMYEGQRFYDCRRWFVANSYFADGLRGWNVASSSKPQDYYNQTILTNRNYLMRDYFWPVRESDLLINPNIMQSFGW